MQKMLPEARSVLRSSPVVFLTDSTATGGRGAEPMMDLLKAFRPIGIDFLSTIVFVALYAITGSIRAGIALGIAVGVIQIGYIFYRGKRPDLMQWASLALVVILGSA